MTAPVKYGLLVAVVVFFVGYVTGMGGSLLPNLGFSALMGVFAGACFAFVQKYANRKQD